MNWEKSNVPRSPTISDLFLSDTGYIATGEPQFQEQLVIGVFNTLDDEHKARVYEKVWELAKMLDARVHGDRWGEIHVFEDAKRLRRAMHRLGLLSKANLFKLVMLKFRGGEGGSQYFSLGEKLGYDPTNKQIGAVNGMGITSDQSGRDAKFISENFAKGFNIHCVFNAACSGFSPDIRDKLADQILKSAKDGIYTKTSYLIAQQIADYLSATKGTTFLQVGISEGAAHVNGALCLLQQSMPHLLPRICILTICPVLFILPEEFPGIQCVNFVKFEDTMVKPWGTNSSKVGKIQHIVVVPNNCTTEHPHSFTNSDYIKSVAPYFDTYIDTGNLHAKK